MFVAGCCQGPTDIPDTVAQASAAAAKAMIPLAQGKVKTETMVSVVQEDACRGCGFCTEACPYNAISLAEKRVRGKTMLVATVNEVLCKSCGACAASCLSGAIQQKAFTDEQILAMIAAVGKKY